MVSEALLTVQYRLTDRDLTLLGWLADHGVLTTPQIAHALYPSVDFAQRRLLKLVGAGLLDRFRPQRPDGGSHPYHYLLAQLGVEVVAAQRDEEELPRRDRARKTRWWLTNRANLPHRLAVNQFFTDLAGHARTHPDTWLDRWWPSSRCQQQGAFAQLTQPSDVQIWGSIVAADGHGIWTEYQDDDTEVRVPFFAEIDLGTEDLARVAAKVGAYQRFANTTGWVWPVLFWLPSAVRERHLHTRLAEHHGVVPVATAAADAATAAGLSPAEAIWWLHGHTASHTAGRRLALIDLAATLTTIPRTYRGG
jgi:hypothetical protein